MDFREKERIGLVEQILFIVVLFNKKPSESIACNGLGLVRDQNKTSVSLFLYDNSDHAHEQSVINNDFQSSFKEVFYQHDKNNSGVAKAYNEGSILARKLNKRWLMLLDQDTAIEPEIFSHYESRIKDHSDQRIFAPVLKDQLGIVSPFRWRLGRGERIGKLKEEYPLKDFRFLNSGLLIELSLYEQVGGYEPSLPFYFSDVYFGEKLRAVNASFSVIHFPLLHGLSATQELTASDALRRYKYYCAGATTTGKLVRQSLFYSINALLRGIKLAMRFRSMDFIKCYFKNIRHVESLL